MRCAHHAPGHTPRRSLTQAGMKCVFDCSSACITRISFAEARSDLLAFGNIKGELWLAELQAGGPVLFKVGDC